MVDRNIGVEFPVGAEIFLFTALPDCGPPVKFTEVKKASTLPYAFLARQQ
jgi:hypothetical protein